MKIWILTGATVALAVAAALVYQAREIIRLEDRLAQLEADQTGIQAAISTAEDSLKTLRRGQTALEEALTALGSVEAAANALMTHHGSALVADLADRLASDLDHAEALRGPEGRKPDTDEVVALLVASGLPRAVADRIWTEHYVELTQMPHFIATVAAAVFETYGADLKPADGIAASPEEVASALALNPAFMTLVKERHP